MSFDQRQKIVCERFVLEENFPDASREKQNIGYYAKNAQNQKVGLSVETIIYVKSNYYETVTHFHWSNSK